MLYTIIYTTYIYPGKPVRKFQSSLIPSQRTPETLKAKLQRKVYSPAQIHTLDITTILNEIDLTFKLKKEIKDAGEDCLNDGKLWVEPQGEEHGEEEDRPECRQGQPCHQVGVSLKSQTGPRFGNIFHLSAIQF